MAVPTKLITTSIGFQNSAGTVVASGFLRLQLSQNAEITSGGGQVTTQPLFLALDVNGKISSQAIWFNDELSPSGTVYSAQLFGSNGVLLIQDFGYWSIVGASADLSFMTSVSTMGTFPNPLLVTPSGGAQSTAGTLSPSANATYSLGSTGVGWKDIIAAGTPWIDVRAYGAVGDGVTDDTVAIQNAINAVPHGGALYIPPKTFAISRQASNAQILLFNYPIKVFGTGMGTQSFASIFLIPNTTPNTVDVIRMVADVNGSDGYVFQDFGVQCNGAAGARSVFNIDTTVVPISRLTIQRVGMWGGFAGPGIRSTNPTPVTNGFFVSCIGPGNVIKNGILLQNAGDSIRIFNNDITFNTAGVVQSFPALDATFVPGAQQTQFWGNNINCTKGGAIHLGAAAQNTYIFNNFFEGGQSGTDTGSNGALIDIDGTAGNPCNHVEIHDNVIQAVTNNINNIRVNFAAHTNIHSNTITRSGGTAVDIITTANALYTQIGFNRWEPTGDVIAQILTDAGTSTQYMLYAPQGGQGFAFGARAYGTSGAVGNPSWSFTAAPATGAWFNPGGSTYGIAVSGNDAVAVTTTTLQVGSGGSLAFASTSAASGGAQAAGMSMSAAGIASLDTTAIGNKAGQLLLKRIRTIGGTAYSGADAAIVLSAGWGTTRTVSAATGFDQAFQFTVNATGTGQAASPTITITFKDGTWTNAPIVDVSRNDNTLPTTATFFPVWSTTATVLTITMNGTPNAAGVYVFTVMVFGT